eukprot:Ihof_evm2s955 gene=Ihof_evmTU2s955
MVPDAFILLNSHRYEVGYTDATPETEMSKETPKRSTSIPGHVEQEYSHNRLLDEQVHVQTLDKARATLNYDTVSSKLKAAAADLNNIRKANEAMESNEPMIAIMTILKDETSLGF